MDEPRLSKSDVAKALGVCVDTVEALMKKGEITYYRIGGQIRFCREDVQKYLDRARVEARPAEEKLPPAPPIRATAPTPEPTRRGRGRPPKPKPGEYIPYMKVVSP